MRLKSLKDWGYTAGDGYSSHESSRYSRYNSNRNSGVSYQRRSTTPALVLLFVFGFTFLGAALHLLQGTQGTEEPSVVIEPVQASERPAVEYVKVLVPIKNIEKGELLKSNMFTSIKRPRLMVADNAVTRINQIDGKFAKAMLPAHFPFVQDWVTAEQPANPLLQQIPDGFRAVTIGVNATSSVEGWARAGAKVDVHWVTEMDGERASKRLVENAKILSAEREVDPNADPNTPIPTTVTLLTSEGDAQKISLAATAGQLVLHLRGFNDSGKAAGSGKPLTLSDLRGDKLPGDERLQGYVRFSDSSGGSEEWALINGKLHKRRK